MSITQEFHSSSTNAVMSIKSEDNTNYFIDVNQRISLPTEYMAESQIVKLKITMPKIILVDAEHRENDSVNVYDNIQYKNFADKKNKSVKKHVEFEDTYSTDLEVKTFRSKHETFNCDFSQNKTSCLLFLQKERQNTYKHFNQKELTPNVKFPKDSFNSCHLANNSRKPVEFSSHNFNAISANEEEDVYSFYSDPKESSKLFLETESTENIIEIIPTKYLTEANTNNFVTKQSGKEDQIPICNNDTLFLENSMNSKEITKNIYQTTTTRRNVSEKALKTTQTKTVSALNSNPRADASLVRAMVKYFESPQTVQNYPTHTYSQENEPEILIRTPKYSVDTTAYSDLSRQSFSGTSVKNTAIRSSRRSLPEQIEKDDVSEIVKDLVLDKFRDALQNFLEKSGNRKRFSFEEPNTNQTSNKWRDSGNNSFYDEDSDVDECIFKSGNVSASTSCEAGINRTFIKKETTEESQERDISSKDEYNENEFLNMALGSELHNSRDSLQTDISTTNRSKRSDEDNSVGTSHLSQLISVDLYASVDRGKKNRQSVATYFSTTDSNESMSSQSKKSNALEHDIHRDNSLLSVRNDDQAELIEEISKTSTIITQVSKALDLCSKVSDFNNSVERIEAEALLLFSTMQKDVLFEEMEKGKGRKIEPLPGHVRLSDIRIPLSWSQEKNAKYTRFFVCILRCGKMIFSSGLLLPNESSELVINKCFYFGDLPDDFEISVQIFSMYARIKNEQQTPTKDCTKALHMVKKLFSARRENECQLDGYHPVRTPSFIRYGRTVITRKTLNMKEFQIENIYPRIPLANFLYTHIDTLLVIKVEHSGFLNVRENSRGIFTWNRQWCVLDGTIMKFWNDPGMENELTPNKTVDLSRCLLQSINAADKSSCSRPKTFFVNIAPKEEDCSSEGLYLSTDTQEEFVEWTTVLNSILAILVRWDSIKS